MELEEVEQKKVTDVMFKRIGVDVPMLPDSEGFAEDELPVRGLAVSNRFGYTLFAHSRGFSVAKTADLVKLAETVSHEVEESLSDESDGTDTATEMKAAKETAIATVTVPNIRSLALSHDELTVGVCGGGVVMFHELAALVHKSDTRPFEVMSFDPQDGTDAKDFSWSPSNHESYFILTNHGRLLLGQLGSPLKSKVEAGVLAASWSADGNHVAHVADDFQLSISTSDFAKTFQIQLPMHLSDVDSDAELHVDAISWARPDSIIVGYVQVNSEGEEDAYPLLVVNSRSGNLSQENSTTVGLHFHQMFPSIDSFVVSSGSGAYMLTDYFNPWKIMVAASRKSIDDHIVIMGWFPEEGKEVLYSLEIVNDAWIPRIELQDSNDDNAVLGLAIDCTTVQVELCDPRDESGDTMLPPCPVLICLTLEGKLSFFSFARLDKVNQSLELVKPPSALPDVKRSAQHTKTQDTRTAAVSPSPPEQNTEKSRDGTMSGEIASEGQTLSARDLKEEPAHQISGNSRPKDPGSLFERFTKPSSLSQGAPASDDRPSDSTPSGLTPVSLDVVKPSSKATSTLKTTGFGLSGSGAGSANMGNAFQSQFRPFDSGGPRSEPLITNTALPSQRVSQVPVAKPSPPGNNVPIKKVVGAPAGNPVPTQPSWDRVLQGGPAAPSRSGTVPSFRDPVNSSSSLSGQPTGNAGSKVATNQTGTERFNPGSQSRVPPPVRAPGVTDMEAAFISELEKLRRMSYDVDHLMSYIEGRHQDTHENAKAFTKQSLEELERSIHHVSEECKSYRRGLSQEKQHIEDLRDEGMRVDAWRIYAESLMAQKSDSRHQELWIHQKLHPELDMKRKRVVRADQDLKLQIAELEGHLHYLELTQWQKGNAGRRTIKHTRSPGQFLSVQHVYNTVNTQMAVAEELSSSLAQQMQALDIRWSSPAKDSRATADGILRSVGASTDDKRIMHSPLSRNQLSFSPMHKEASMRRESSPSPRLLEPTLQETTRRRRDSMDAAWVEREAPTTTIKRIVRTRPTQSYAPANSNTTANRQGNFSSLLGMPRNENLQGLQHARQAQSSRMGPTPAAPSFPNLSFQGSGSLSGQTGLSSSALQSQNSRGEQRQAWPAFPFGDSTRSSGSNQAAAITGDSHNSREGLFKWASNVQTASSQSKTSSNVPVLSGPTPKQFVGHSSEGASSSSMANSSRTFTRMSQPGPAGSTGGFFNSSIPSFSKSSIGGTSEGSDGSFLAASKSTSLSKLGVSQGQRSGSLTSTQGQSDGSRVEHREVNQRSDSSSFSSSTPHLAGPNPSLRPTLSAPTTRLSASTATPQLDAPTLFSQSSGPPSLSATANSPASSFQRAQSRKSGIEPDKNPELLNPVRNVPSFAKTDPSKFSIVRSDNSGSTQDTGVHQKDYSGKEEDTTNQTIFQQIEQPAASSSVFGGGIVKQVDLKPSKPSPGLASSQAPLRVSFSSSFPSMPLDTSAPHSVSSSTKSSDAPTELFSSTTLPALSNVGSKAREDPAIRTSATPTPIATVMSLDATLDLEEPAVSSSLTSMNMGAPLTPSEEIPVRESTTSNSFSSASAGSASPFSPSISTPLSVPVASAPSQPAGSIFASSSVPAFSTTSSQSGSLSPFGQSSLWQSSPQTTQQPFVFPGSSSGSMASTATITASPAESTEEDMEEEASAGLNSFGGFGGLGLGSSGTTQSQKTNPFGSSLSGNPQPFQLSSPASGQLLRPAAFSLPAAQSPSQQAGGNAFGGGFGSPGFSQNNLFSEAGKGFGSPTQQTAGGFGQPAQLGPGQQALGSALGTFGQTRQVGFGTPFGGGMGSNIGGGFANTAPGGGFASPGGGGGFANAASGGGFASAGAGGGFAGAALGGGFGGGFGGAAAAPPPGFGSVGAGGGFGGVAGGAFQAFGGNQGSAVNPSQTNLFTQMRK